MTDLAPAPDVAVLGGPLHRLAGRLGLVGDRTNTIRLGFALGVVLWGGLLLLATLEGIAGRMLTLELIGGHLRLLLALPLLFVCEAWWAPSVAEFVASLRRGGLVDAANAAAFDADVRRLERRAGSAWAEAACLAIAVAMGFLAQHVGVLGTSAVRDDSRAAAAPLTNFWYWSVCLPVFRFVLARWAWRLVCWWAFLWRLTGARLRLDAMHPDRAGGLRYLELVQCQFSPLVAALSVVQASVIAEEISAGRRTLGDSLPSLGLVLLVDLLLFVGPVLQFAPMLWRCRLAGLSRYQGFASRYVHRFDDKWLSDAAGKRDEDPLGTADLQSLADLGNSFGHVQDMSFVPAGRPLAVQLAVAALLPWLPLLLFQYPLTELVRTFLHSIAGV